MPGPAPATPRRLLLLVVTGDGPAGALPEAWRSYDEIDKARVAASAVLRNPRVLRVGIVESDLPLRLVEWVA